ncbi:MAG: tetratricopeptide repeat protein [Candidatus Heimdallarchaeota archaeon]|nr:tetratricopeptide repeat protein [Candidatus Heimdallarchaeota archaeon]MCK4954902.1 tetratricopeptide repeat protein [Candidatus Heimdallarchaeota archaeon]
MSEKDGIKNFISIKELEQLVISGKYKEAIEIIDEIIVQEGIPEEERFSYFIWKSQIYNKTSIFDEALKIANDVLEFAERVNNIQLKLDALENKGEALWRTGRFNESLKVLGQYKENIFAPLDNNIEDFTKREAFYYYWLGLYYFLGENDFDKSQENIEKCFELYNSLKDTLYLGRCNEVLGWTYLYKKDLEKARKYAKESLRLYEETKNQREIGWSLFLNGWVNYFSDELDKAKTNVEKSLPLFESLGMQQCVAYLHNFLSLIYMNEGEFDKSIEHSEIGLKILEAIDYKQDLLFSSVAKTLVHFSKKDLDSTIENMKKTLHLLTSKADKYETVLVLNDIGKVYHQKGDFEEAQKNYIDSLEIAREIDDKITTANILFSLFSVGLELSDIENTNSYLQQLKELNNLTEELLIKQYTEVAECLILKTSTRAINRGKAESELKRILEQKINDINLEIIVLCNLCEILLTDFPLSRDQEILIELNEYISRLMSLAKNQRMFSIIVETYRFQSQLALAELNLKDARELLAQARAIAEEKGLERLTEDITEDQKKVEKQLEMWLEMSARKASIFETIDHVSLDEILKNISKEKTLSTIEGKKDETLMFKKLFSIKM